MDKIIENIEKGIANGKAKAAANSKLNDRVMPANVGEELGTYWINLKDKDGEEKVYVQPKEIDTSNDSLRFTPETYEIVILRLCETIIKLQQT